MSEYVMYMGLEQKKMFDAVVAHQYKPTEETKATLDRLYAENEKRLIESQAKKEAEFIGLYGQELFDFVKGISEKEYFLVSKDKPFYLSWTVEDDSENEEYWAVRFINGSFSYANLSYSGYGETKVLEDNISQQRVLELINLKKETV